MGIGRLHALATRALLIVLLAAEAVGGEVPLQQSACGKPGRFPQGTGYRPAPGSKSCLYTAPNGGGRKECYPMDLTARPFDPENREDALRRYGPNFHGLDENIPRFLAVDFESIYQTGSIAMSKTCCEGAWGTQDTLSCFPTNTELHDYFAVEPARSSLGRGRRGPGWPSIESVTSPAPGMVNVRWKTYAHDAFEVLVGDTVKAVPGDQFSATVEVPLGGEFEVTVIGMLGGAKGRPARAKRVIIAPAGPPAVPTTPTPPAQDPPIPSQEDRLMRCPDGPGAVVTLPGFLYRPALPSTGRVAVKIIPCEPPPEGAEP